jgi:hypothetical protein
VTASPDQPAGRSTASIALILAVLLGTLKLGLYHQAVAGRIHPAGIILAAASLSCLWLALSPLRARWMLAAWTVQSAWLLPNWGYAVYFHAPLWWGTMAGATGVGALAVAHGALPLDAAMWLLLADLPALLVYLCWRQPAAARTGWLAAAALSLLLFSATAWAWWRLPMHEADRLRIHPVVELIAQTGPLPVQLADALRGSGPGPQAGPPVVIASSGQPRDVLVIQVESLDAGSLDWRLADGIAAMPRLAARAAFGTHWRHCLAYHGPGGSSDGEYAVVNGREPTWNAPVINRRGLLFEDSLPHLLSAQGWHCRMVLGLYGFFFNYVRIQPRVGYAWQGLEELGLIQHEGEFGARDGEFVDAVLRRLPTLPSPALLHCTTMSGHIPWRQWRNLPACAGTGLAGTGTADDYARTLRYVDLHLDRLIAGFLAARPEALIVVFGDHSAGIDTDGYASPRGRRDGVTWEFVPAILLGQGVPVRRIDLAACQLDLRRTILRLSGWSGTVSTWGMDLADPDAPAAPLRFHGHDYDRREIGTWAAGLGRHGH